MNDTEKMLKELGYKTMFHITDDEMEALVKEYHVFMNHVQALEAIDTNGVEPLAFPYEVETTFLRDDNEINMVDRNDALSNAHNVQDNQVKVPKVVG